MLTLKSKNGKWWILIETKKKMFLITIYYPRMGRNIYGKRRKMETLHRS
jgi:hypothetical protein